jgi:hypothetical protein
MRVLHGSRESRWGQITPRVGIYNCAYLGVISCLYAELVELLRKPGLDALEQVPIHTQSEGGVAVAHALRDGQRVGAKVDQKAGMAVPEVVSPDGLGQPGRP